MVEPISYQGGNPDDMRRATDLAHLKTLAICHYVWGGIIVAMSCIFVFHLIFGIVLLSHPHFFNKPGMVPQRADRIIGVALVGFASVAMVLGWTMGLLTIYSGRCLHRQRKRVFSMVIAGIECLSVPFGTTLGVFTFVVLARPSVVEIYREKADPRQSRGL